MPLLDGFVLLRCIGVWGFWHLVAVQEGEASDEVAVGGVVLVHAANEHLRVVAEELEGGEHGKAAVVELLVGLGESLLGGLEGSETSLVGQSTSLASGVKGVVDVADEEDHLHPAEGRDGLDGGNAVGDGGERNARGDDAGESEELGNDVAEDSELANTAVLELSGSVESEGLSIDISGKREGIEVADGISDASLGLVAHLQGGGASHTRNGGEGGGADEGSEDSESTEHFSICGIYV
jgi:hypothetical protein